MDTKRINVLMVEAVDKHFDLIEGFVKLLVKSRISLEVCKIRGDQKKVSRLAML